MPAIAGVYPLVSADGFDTLSPLLSLTSQSTKMFCQTSLISTTTNSLTTSPLAWLMISFLPFSWWLKIDSFWIKRTPALILVSYCSLDWLNKKSSRCTFNGLMALSTAQFPQQSHSLQWTHYGPRTCWDVTTPWIPPLCFPLYLHVSFFHVFPLATHTYYINLPLVYNHLSPL